MSLTMDNNWINDFFDKKKCQDHYKVIENGILIEFKKTGADGNGITAFVMTSDSYSSLHETDWDKGCKIFRKWTKKWNLHYYARPHGNFHMFEAYKEAHQKGCRGVVVEDMS